MVEAQQGFATLDDDIDGDTFVRFIEWAHKGHYAAAAFSTVESQSPSASGSPDHDGVMAIPHEEHEVEEIAVPEPEPIPPLEWGFNEYRPSSSYRKGKKSKYVSSEDLSVQQRQRELEAFISRKYTVRQDFLQTPRPNRSPEEDYTEVFLSHAQLFVFADKYDIQPLKMLALEELHATLAKYTLYPVRTGDVVSLLRYVYRNTGGRKEDTEDLRSMMMQYVSYEMDSLIGDKSFAELMSEDGGALLGDFMTTVRKRIS